MEKNKCPNSFVLLLFISIMMAIGCGKNNTTYYADGEDPGLAIFSKAGYNILTCYVNDKVWRTKDRITTAVTFRTFYEVYLDRISNSTLRDTIQMLWDGYFANDESNTGTLTLQLALPSRVNAGGLSALNGQRIKLDTTNSYFSFSGPGILPVNRKGTGNIYFHTARFDSTFNSFRQNNISGLFDADFGNFKITRGRFDHVITPQQVQF